ncbi:unnamed protein product [Adineta steineri]|uniref:Uncharacterized protein n=1 Tax=Adineta steineri TaxID=433720 RepID=A0A818FLP4_9BILA|nr:unnamed protein product [Adineta steineri]CAF3475610.1 unnamed protein product [Adineta steineri]
MCSFIFFVLSYYKDRLLNYIPNVQSLCVHIYTDLQNVSNYSSINNSSIINSSIRSLQISTINNIPFNHIENLFKNSFKSLQTLKFFFKTDASSQSCLDYIDDKRWEFLLQSLESLENFHCCIELPIQSKLVENLFEQNQFFLKRNWVFFIETYTYSFNTICRLYTKPYLKRRIDIIPSKAFVVNNNSYSRVRDLRILIDIIPVNISNNISELIYKNVTSLTLISNKSFNEQSFLTYLYSIINQTNLFYLTIQLDNCSKHFLLNLIENCSKLYSLTLSTYHSWSKLIQLSSQISKSNLRSLTVYELFIDFNQYYLIHQLFNQLEILSLTVTTIEDCYRLLSLLFIGNKRKTLEKIRSLSIKCDFNEPDTIANWIRSNILRKLSYKCTTSVLFIWF